MAYHCHVLNAAYYGGAALIDLSSKSITYRTTLHHDDCIPLDNVATSRWNVPLELLDANRPVLAPYE